MWRRTIPFQIKALSKGEFEGYGSTFGNVDLGGDVIVHGAFSKGLQAHAENGTQVKMLWNHRMSDLPIGVWTHIKEDEKGLWVKGQLADTTMGNDIRALMQLGAIDSMSIGFTVPEGGMDFERGGIRLIKEIDLWEVSPVNFPMNPKAVIEGVKSQYDGPRQLERALRQRYSVDESKRIVHDVFSSVRREEKSDEDDLREVDQDVLAALRRANELKFAALLRMQRKT